MESQAFNLIDVGVIVIVVLSTFVGLLRGITREVLGLFGWLGAVLAVLYGLPLLRPWGRSYISNPAIADVVVSLGLFLVTLIVLSLISRLVANRVKESMLGGLDRSLGLIFGVLRGFFIVCLLYLLAILFFHDTLPQSLDNARSSNFLEKGARMIQEMVPEDFVAGLSENPALASRLKVPDLADLPDIHETVKNLSRLQPMTAEAEEEKAAIEKAAAVPTMEQLIGHNNEPSDE